MRRAITHTAHTLTPRALLTSSLRGKLQQGENERENSQAKKIRLSVGGRQTRLDLHGTFFVSRENPFAFLLSLLAESHPLLTFCSPAPDAVHRIDQEVEAQTRLEITAQQKTERVRPVSQLASKSWPLVPSTISTTKGHQANNLHAVALCMHACRWRLNLRLSASGLLCSAQSGYAEHAHWCDHVAGVVRPFTDLSAINPSPCDSQRSEQVNSKRRAGTHSRLVSPCCRFQSLLALFERE